MHTSTHPHIHTQVVVALVHGDGLNECQWLYGRTLMRAHGWHNQASVTAINLFSGPFLVKKSGSETTAQCSALAVEQINAHIHKEVSLIHPIPINAHIHKAVSLSLIHPIPEPELPVARFN